MEPVWLRLGGGPPVGQAASFGFSWRVAVSQRKPPLLGVGFPWISLDSLVRIEPFQWVTGQKRGEYFWRPCPRVEKRPDGGCGRGYAEAQDCSWGELTLVSDFVQDIAVKAAPRRLNPKAARSKVQSPSAAQVELRR